MRPALNFNSIQAKGKPTEVVRGTFKGFSLPIYSADDEELFYEIKTPVRWDGITNPIMEVHGWLSGAEDVGDKFKLQFSWNYSDCKSILSSTTIDKEVETTIVEGRAGQYTVYCIDFELDTGGATQGDILAGRLRRIAASTNEISGEIAIFNWVVLFKIDKPGGRWG